MNLLHDRRRLSRSLAVRREQARPSANSSGVEVSRLVASRVRLREARMVGMVTTFVDSWINQAPACMTKRRNVSALRFAPFPHHRPPHAMRLVIFGQAAFGADSYARLKEDGHSIAAVFVPPDGPRGEESTTAPTAT